MICSKIVNTSNLSMTTTQLMYIGHHLSMSLKTFLHLQTEMAMVEMGHGVVEEMTMVEEMGHWVVEEMKLESKWTSRAVCVYICV